MDRRHARIIADCHHWRYRAGRQTSRVDVELIGAVPNEILPSDADVIKVTVPPDALMPPCTSGRVDLPTAVIVGAVAP